MDIGSSIKEFIERARIARLATANLESMPHVVPVVFVFDGTHFAIPVDKKTKSVKPEKLRRVMNINANPNVALLIDEYSEDWTKLAFVLIQGRASIVNKSQKNTQLQEAHKKLISKYPQYQNIGLGESCIIIKPEKIASWPSSEA